MTHLPFVYDDGGRAAAGYRGNAGDCVTRAIAIASGQPYQAVYDSLFHLGRAHVAAKKARGRTPRHGASPRDGVVADVYKPWFDRRGWVWTPTMGIGTGTTVHLRADELPATGRLVVRCSKHLAAVIDGVLHDTYDCSRDGTRAVYGYWTAP